MKKGQHVGYCPHCNLMLAAYDRKGKDLSCPRCQRDSSEERVKVTKRI